MTFRRELLSGSIHEISSTLFDEDENLVFAFGLNRILASAPNKAIRVKRASDETELDIGWDSNGNFDISAYSSFISGTTGVIVKWYDQKSGNDCVLNDAIKAPVYNAGDSNYVPAIDFIGDKGFVSQTFPFSNLNASVFTVLNTYQREVSSHSLFDRYYSTSNGGGLLWAYNTPLRFSGFPYPLSVYANGEQLQQPFLLNAYESKSFVVHYRLSLALLDFAVGNASGFTSGGKYGQAEILVYRGDMSTKIGAITKRIMARHNIT